MAVVAGTAIAAQIGAKEYERIIRSRAEQESIRLQIAYASGGQEALERDVARIAAEKEARAEREAKAAARNPRRPDRFDFTWHAAMCAAESARLRGERPAIDLPWEPAFEAES
jgi:hypothetical protein